MRTSIAHEIDDIRAVAAVIREPMLVVGHSSGGVIALEALMAIAVDVRQRGGM